ncbi:hypothetical protein EN851_05330 [Mesorhizobium sp. M8A.F.Ca.ET.208.01.1.1]|uniref:hypothetical protein n=1 Tax=unclassified Mesorhizobium TaxID=325217 RepID=UPI001093BFC9|nr:MULTISPECIES: hypothetical protein [unclassified Mesorhizobium]TGQ94973.1 hypothetical protein EN851_05330 [Mesorhizobium sp. M8A.F.Ca.ET.208.01.1.1]TGT55462.1 hypothetical protein EN810_05330 [Mesorhizobium sp. M8A.F.Ca.ET.167.01.1.1]
MSKMPRYRVVGLSREQLDEIARSSSLTIEKLNDDKIFVLGGPEFTVKAEDKAVRTALDIAGGRVAMCKAMF